MKSHVMIRQRPALRRKPTLNRSRRYVPVSGRTNNVSRKKVAVTSARAMKIERQSRNRITPEPMIGQ